MIIESVDLTAWIIDQTKKAKFEFDLADLEKDGTERLAKKSKLLGQLQILSRLQDYLG